MTVRKSGNWTGTNLGQVYAEFQSYVKSLKDYGSDVERRIQE